MKKSEKKVEISEEQEDYLLKVLFKLCKIPGQPGKEDKVLEFIKHEIQKSYLEPIQDQEYGMYVVVPAKKESRESAIIESHVDIVQPECMDPKINNEKIITATGLDNRIHVAILLTMIRFCRFDYRSYIPLFTVKEEIGFVGARFFTNTISLEGVRYVKWPISRIIILDATFARLPNGQFNKEFQTYGGHSKIRIMAHFNENPNLIPTIGKGFSPIHQKSTPTEGLVESWCNYSVFHRSSNSNYYRPNNRTHHVLYSVPVVDMHHRESFASLKDAFSLYKFLKERMSDEC